MVPIVEIQIGKPFIGTVHISEVLAYPDLLRLAVQGGHNLIFVLSPNRGAQDEQQQWKPQKGPLYYQMGTD